MGMSVPFCSVATLNEYACKGLDKLQETLPALQKPTYQVRGGFVFVLDSSQL